MASKEDIKNNIERLKIENQIADSVERQTNSLGDWRKGQKELRENAKKIKKLDEDILAITKAVNKAKKEGIEFSTDELALINKSKAELEKKKSQLVDTNKELSKSVSLLKAAGNTALGAIKSVLPSLSEVIKTVLDLDDKLRDTAATIGLSGVGFQSMKMASEDLRDSGARWGFGLNYGLQVMASYSQETGRAVILSKEVGEQMAVTARATGMSAEEMGGLVGQMEAFGLGAGQSAEIISNIQAMSEQMGVNSSKVIKKFQDNLGMLNKFNFRGGTKALASMAAHSEKFKLSMEQTAAASEKLFKMEDAIEASAKLQMMGGAMSQLADPFQLMYQARNAPEELAKSLSKAAKESAVFNKETGEFEVNALELSRLRESADALGMDYTELVKTAKQAAKIDYLEKFLPSGMSEEDKGILTGMTNMTDKGAMITFADERGDLQTKLLSQLSVSERKNIVKRAASDKERAEQAMSVAKQWQSIQDSILLVAVEMLQPIMDFLNSDQGKSWINGIKETIIGWATSIREFFRGPGSWDKLKAQFMKYKDEIILGIKIGAATFIGIWIGAQLLAGMKFGLGFRMTSGAGVPGVGGGAPDMTKAAGMGNMLSGIGSAITIIGVAGALWILADALIKFNDVEWSSLAKGGLALAGLAIGLQVMKGPLTAFSNPTNFVGVAVLLAIGGAMLMIGQSAMLMAAGGTTGLIGMTIALVGMVAIITVLGGLAAGGIGFLGVGLLLAIGAAMLMVGAAAYLIGAGISMVVNSFTNLFSILSLEMLAGLFLLGPALMSASLGIIALGAAILIMGLTLASPFGLLGLIALGVAAVSLNEAFSNVDAGGITEAVSAVNSVNKENIDALASLSAWLAYAGSNIKIEFGEINVNGAIDLNGEGGATADSKLLSDPIFLNKLQTLIKAYTNNERKGYGANTTN